MYSFVFIQYKVMQFKGSVVHFHMNNLFVLNKFLQGKKEIPNKLFIMSLGNVQDHTDFCKSRFVL